MLFLGFSKNLGKDLRYVPKDNVLHVLNRRKENYTLAETAAFDTALFTSGDDLLSWYPKVQKKAKDILLLAASDPDDFDGDTLSDIGINAIERATKLLVCFPSQKRALEGMGVRKDIEVLSPEPTYVDEEMAKEEETAFRSYYRIGKETPIVLSYGFFQDKECFRLLEGLARILPNIAFFYFGPLDKEFLRQKRQERLSKSLNIRYEAFLPEELYRSALLNVDFLFLPQKRIVLPNVLIDFLAQGAIVLRKEGTDYPELADRILFRKDIAAIRTALLTERRRPENTSL